MTPNQMKKIIQDINRAKLTKTQIVRKHGYREYLQARALIDYWERQR